MSESGSATAVDVVEQIGQVTVILSISAKTRKWKALGITATEWDVALDKALDNAASIDPLDLAAVTIVFKGQEYYLEELADVELSRNTT